jgi:hypothetical protein
VCRSHKRVKSAVLPTPYFDDVQYCLYLSAEGEVDKPGAFLISGEAEIEVAINPASGYYQPKTPDEITPFGPVVAKLVTETRAKLVSTLTNQGWLQSELFGETIIAPPQPVKE